MARGRRRGDGGRFWFWFWCTFYGDKVDRDDVRFGDKVIRAAEMSGVVAVNTGVGRRALQVGDRERLSGTSGDGRV